MKMAIFIFPARKFMLIGEYTHTLDPKKRLSLPAKFRKEMGKKVVITRGLDKCLFIYPVKQWGRISEKIAELSIGQADSRGFNRFLLSGAVETDVDSAGRVLVPDFLKDFAGLLEKVVVTGVHSRVEVWDEKAWNEYKGRIEKQADVLAEKLGEIGVI
ncbi:MAG: division/cell wall cluster transcriptional repressor MraZ [Patescibacteria group bacterium]